MPEWLDWKFLRDVCLVLVPVFSLTGVKDLLWVQDHYKLFVSGVIMLAALGITAGRINDTESQSKLSAALQRLENEGKETTSLQNELLKSQKENFALQRQLAEKAESEKLEKAKLESAREEQEMERRNNFTIPLTKLIERGKVGMRGAVSTPGLEAAQRVHGPMAKKWFYEAVQFLRTHCSDEVWRDFWGPTTDPNSMEFPTDNINSTQGVLRFYQVRIENLEKLLKDNVLRCKQLTIRR